MYAAKEGKEDENKKKVYDKKGKGLWFVKSLCLLMNLLMSAIRNNEGATSQQEDHQNVRCQKGQERGK
jgi:hypothetical protein